MAAGSGKKATVTKGETKQAKEYKITGGSFKTKEEANMELEKAFAKGFKKAGLMVRGREFMVLFGTYASAQIAKANLEAITKAGFEANVLE